MPAAQREITNREVRFTVRFGTTITIAARPVPASSVAGDPQHAAPGPNQARDRASRHSEVDGAADTEFASDAAPGAGGNNRRLRTINDGKGGDLAPDA
jgi:hypothetical protein